ncbi:hypothetical protein KIN20_015434 [Parelaphostrongylus tenuis]|uniref:Uncharacterized protein n=1 Tax=Parelaphostrongylus tenuis TaxID=148309 RepID=A0AAD5MIH6_PARTN|nr:hypothetical protein KIN20_015434 [Parelaphostrongylus tenuis]
MAELFSRIMRNHLLAYVSLMPTLCLFSGKTVSLQFSREDKVEFHIRGQSFSGWCVSWVSGGPEFDRAPTRPIDGSIALERLTCRVQFLLFDLGFFLRFQRNSR